MQYHYVKLGIVFFVVAVFVYALYTVTLGQDRVVMYQGDYRVLQPHHDEIAHGTSSRILFTGDIFLGRDVERRMLRAGTDHPFHLFDQLPERAATVINFEAAISEQHNPTPDFGMQFSVRMSFVEALKRAGITHVSLANNHAYDFGRSGYVHTRDVFKSFDITSFGHPSQVTEELVAVIHTPHADVAVVGIHTLYGQPSLFSISETYAKVADEADVVVAYVHWGEEYRLHHNRAQRVLAEQLVAVGFDLIIGHHPHVVQGVEMIDGVPVVYSLGNTIFDQYFSDEVQEGLLATVQFTEGSRQLMLTPITSIASRNQPQLMSEPATTAFLASVAERSDVSVQSAVRSGVLEW